MTSLSRSKPSGEGERRDSGDYVTQSTPDVAMKRLWVFKCS